MRRWMALPLAGLVAGCASGVRVPEVVKVPVPVPCSVAVPGRPSLASDLDLLAMGDRDLVLALGRDRERLLGYAQQLEAAVEGCR